MTPIDLTLLRQGIAAGDSVASLADRLGVSTWVVEQALKEHGLKTRYRRGGARRGAGRRPKLSEDEARALVTQARAEGWTQAQAASHVGLGGASLSRILRRYGVAWKETP